jgi:hypothetical protein
MRPACSASERVHRGVSRSSPGVDEVIATTTCDSRSDYRPASSNQIGNQKQSVISGSYPRRLNGALTAPIGESAAVTNTEPSSRTVLASPLLLLRIDELPEQQ